LSVIVNHSTLPIKKKPPFLGGGQRVMPFREL
jgi:hypothetical protein